MGHTTAKSAEIVQPLVKGVARDLWRVYASQVEKTRDFQHRTLLLPAVRGRDATRAEQESKRRRISEQEARVLFVLRLDRLRHVYGVEVPTTLAYRQQGVVPTAGRTDLVVYNGFDPEKRVLNIELKCGTGEVEAFRKDLEQLLHEGCDSLWWHVVLGEPALRSVVGKMIDAVPGSITEDTNPLSSARRSLWFAFCLLNKKELRIGRVELEGKRHIEALLEEILSAVNRAPLAKRHGWTTYRLPPSRSSTRSRHGPGDQEVSADTEQVL